MGCSLHNQGEGHWQKGFAVFSKGWDVPVLQRDISQAGEPQLTMLCLQLPRALSKASWNALSRRNVAATAAPRWRIRAGGGCGFNPLPWDTSQGLLLE